MKTYKFILGIIFILSLSLNAAFLINLLTVHPSHTETQENPPELNLTNQQKKQMEPIRVKIHRDNEAIKKQIHQCQEKLVTALKAEPVDKQAINQCIDNISNLQKKIQQNTIEEIIQVKKYMNPDQCNCLIEGLGAAMHQTAKSCNCPYCAHQLSENSNYKR
jgi:Spy/CpxP family protein refolding chaperone